MTSDRIHCFSDTMASAPTPASAPAELPPGRLAEALAILMVDLVGVLPVRDRTEALERLANRLDDQSRTPRGSDAAALLGDVGAALMRLGL